MRRPTPRAIADDVGYTLLELMVVLAILALAGGLGLRLALGPPAGLSLTAVAQDLAVEARRARLLALQRGQDALLMLDVERRTYWVEGHGAVVPISSDIRLEMTTAAPERLSSSVGGIRFFADGTSTGGEVRLIHAGQTRRVKIDWLVGDASVLDE